MTPAEELRAAAAKMREMANRVPSGPWRADGSEIYSADYSWVGETLNESVTVTESHSAYIASWHPAVALAVVDWLDLARDRIVREIWHPDSDNAQAALAVARAYLGGA